MIGIYKITNQVNGKCYIGQSVNIKRRWTAEKNKAFDELDKCYNYPLSRAIRKYGLENFLFEVIEECTREELNEKERYWINRYDTYFNGYNQSLGGDNSTAQMPKESTIGIINDLKNTQMKHKEIAEKWNVSTEMVQGINTGRYWYQDNVEYPLQKRKVVIKEFYCEKCGKEITRQAKLCVECAQIASRKVERPSKEELFKELTENQGNFTKVGNNHNVTDNTIRKWCKAYDLPFHSKDYK